MISFIPTNTPAKVEVLIQTETTEEIRELLAGLHQVADPENWDDSPEDLALVNLERVVQFLQRANNRLEMLVASNLISIGWIEDSETLEHLFRLMTMTGPGFPKDHLSVIYDPLEALFIAPHARNGYTVEEFYYAFFHPNYGKVPFDHLLKETR